MDVCVPDCRIIRNNNCDRFFMKLLSRSGVTEECGKLLGTKVRNVKAI